MMYYMSTEEYVHLTKTIAEQAAEIERLKGMVDEIQAAKYVHKEHNRLLAEIESLRDALNEALKLATSQAEWSAELTRQRDELESLRNVIQLAADDIRRCDYTPARSKLLVAIAAPKEK